MVDARKWGGEASWAGAGMLVPGSEYEEASDAMRSALQSLTLYPDFVRELTALSGLPIDFSLCGSIELAGNESELEAIGQRAQRQGALQVRAERLSRSDLAYVVPGIDQELAGGFLYPGEGQVDPRAVTAALRVACARGGVTIREHDPVVGLAWGKGKLVASLV